MLKVFTLLIAFIVPLTFNAAIVSSTTTSQEALDDILLPAPQSLVVDVYDPPVRVIIPSIGLNAPVEKVGVNSKGEVDVPDGSTNNVGWYSLGPAPGQMGSAILDAHVFAAFSDLRYLKIGQEIDVQTVSGATLHFIVEDSRVYTLDEVPLQYVFNRADTERLDLITCAGKPTPDGSTYDHRLIVYAQLVH